MAALALPPPDRRSYRIGPFEVESALIEHPAVVESAVVSSPDPTRGEVVKAFVVLAPDYASHDPEALIKELQDHVKKVTAPYKYPRKMEFVPHLPKTISGKIRRNELRKKEVLVLKKEALYWFLLLQYYCDKSPEVNSAVNQQEAQQDQTRHVFKHTTSTIFFYPGNTMSEGQNLFSTDNISTLAFYLMVPSIAKVALPESGPLKS
ncbi:Acyl-coenzyme A synthetase ACSM3, mitochondrial [Varanus komodoensis]|nr:Acyl-coenzyme A synthetase ACSM3, mitochondrial [Varanus komodoensis]